MKKILTALLLLYGCTSVKIYQSFETTSAEKLQKEKNGCYVFENDSVKIVYDFFAENGKMWFILFNKKNIPLYIDWNKSSLIVNSNKVAYWNDNVVTRGQHISDTRYYEVYPDYPLSTYASYFLQRQYGLSESITSHPERITVIPPKAQWYKVQYNLCSMGIVPQAPFSTTSLERTSLMNGREKDLKEDAFQVEYTLDKSPLVFSNFLTLSYAENFANEFYITNQFYASRITEMNKRFYKGIMVNHQFNYPYIIPTNFSKLIRDDDSMENRDTRCTYIFNNGHQCRMRKKEGFQYCEMHHKN